MRDDDAADDRYTDLLAQLLEELDTLDRQRGQLSQARTLAVNQLLSHLGVSRKALAAFLARRKLDQEDRAHYDASLSELCNLDDAPLQPDMFDLASVRAEPGTLHGEIRGVLEIPETENIRH